jgi:hypothetical protein
MQPISPSGAMGARVRSDVSAPRAPAPIEVTCGGMLCRLRVWSDSEWAALPVSERPLEWTHVPGLGWVGAVPVASLN